MQKKNNDLCECYYFSEIGRIPVENQQIVQMIRKIGQKGNVKLPTEEIKALDHEVGE